MNRKEVNEKNNVRGVSVKLVPRATTGARIVCMRDLATEAGCLVPLLQSLTMLASLRRFVLAQQPSAMALPLASPASCELRSVIRFLAAKKKSAKEIHEELCQVYGEECMSSGMVRRWVRDFKNGRTDVHDEARAGRPSVSDETIAKVEAAMLEDRRTTVRELCEKIPEVSKTTIDKILTEHLGYSTRTGGRVL